MTPAGVDLALANRVIGPEGSHQVAEFAESSHQLSHLRGARVVLASDDVLDQLRLLVAAVIEGFRVALVPRTWLTEEWRARFASEFDVWLSRLEDARTARPSGAAAIAGGEMSVFTSGSTGQPRAVTYPIERLSTFDRVAELPIRRWLLTARTGSYAWTQTVILALTRPGQELVLPRDLTPTGVLSALRRGVTAISSTPSFWRYILAAVPQEELAEVALGQITLGGEAVDGMILERLRRIWPQARLTHIYASTEAGAAFAVSDGLPGYPVARLADDSGPTARVDSGTLWLRSRYGAAGDQTWFDTGDLAEVSEGRLHIRGRRDHDEIKVAGNRVSLPEIEQVAHDVPGVGWARAYPVPSAIVGYVVGVEVVIDRARMRPFAEVERDLRTSVRTRLGPYSEPRVVRQVDLLEVGPGFKRATG